MLIPAPVRSERSPREYILEKFGAKRGVLPIKGGWGYTQEDACIIVKDDPSVDRQLPFDGVAVEHAFVDKRMRLELKLIGPPADRYGEPDWNLVEQSMLPLDDGRFFDHMVFNVIAFAPGDAEKLREALRGPEGVRSEGFDHEAHQRERQSMMLRWKREFWFDISSFFGVD